jgi:hypothetical protein
MGKGFNGFMPCVSCHRQSSSHVVAGVGQSFILWDPRGFRVLWWAKIAEIGTQGSSLLNGYEVLGQGCCQILHCFCPSVGQSCSSLCHLCFLEEIGFNQHRGKGTFPIYISDCVYSNHCLILGTGNETLLQADFLLFCFFFAETVNDDNWNAILFFWGIISWWLSQCAEHG